MKLIYAFVISLLITLSSASADQANILQPEGSIDESVTNQLQEGRWELVMFWATYCPICKKDFEKLAEFIEDNPSMNLTVIGVVTDGIESKQKALNQIDTRDLNYTHVLTNFDRSNELYQDISQTRLIGVPSQLLYNPKNELAGFSRNAIDLDSLEILVYE